MTGHRERQFYNQKYYNHNHMNHNHRGRHLQPTIFDDNYCCNVNKNSHYHCNDYNYNEECNNIEVMRNTCNAICKYCCNNYCTCNDNCMYKDDIKNNVHGTLGANPAPQDKTITTPTPTPVLFKSWKHGGGRR